MCARAHAIDHPKGPRAMERGRVVAIYTMAQTCALSLVDVLPDELLSIVLGYVSCARSITSAAATCRRLYAIVMCDPYQHVWRSAVERTATRSGLCGPWIGVAAKVRGWPWLARALGPLPQNGDGIGLFSGAGTGTVTMGEFRGGQPHGYAVRIKATDSWAHGNWTRGDHHGHLCKIDLDRTYDGQWRTGMRHGWGTLVVRIRDDGASDDGGSTDRQTDLKAPTARTYVYSGEWSGNKREGRGAEIQSNGDTYDGQWLSDARHGVGTYRASASGDIYRGEWKDNACHGRGTFERPLHGIITEGTWCEGSVQGAATLRYANGDLFEVVCHDGIAINAVRYVCGPDCADPVFRGCVIDAPAWIHAVADDDDGTLGLHDFLYPDPVSSPLAFRVFCAYFERGLLACGGAHASADAMAALLRDAARRLPR